MDIRNELLDHFDNMESSEIAEAWNEYLDRDNSAESRVYPMYELCDLIGDLPFRAALDQLCLDNFSLSDGWIIETMFGYESTDCIEDYIYLTELTDYIADNYDSIERDYTELFKLSELYNELIQTS